MLAIFELILLIAVIGWFAKIIASRKVGNVTVSGVLERAYFSKVRDVLTKWKLEGQMKIRLENGRVIDARYSKQLWFGSFFVAVSRGDKVQVTGHWDDNIFRAHSIYNIETGEEY